MTDIVERLRVGPPTFAGGEGADEIERLRQYAIELEGKILLRDEDIDRIRADRELLAQMMIRQSMSTGHGDTVADLVRELEPQVERLRAEAASWEKQAEERTKDAVQLFRNGGYVQTRPYLVLKMAVEAMMAPLGYHGTISARDDRVQAVMDALAQIDEVEQ